MWAFSKNLEFSWLMAQCWCERAEAGHRVLRVIDDWIIPTIASGNTNALTMAIAGRAAELILGGQSRGCGGIEIPRTIAGQAVAAEEVIKFRGDHSCTGLNRSVTPRGGCFKRRTNSLVMASLVLSAFLQSRQSAHDVTNGSCRRIIQMIPRAANPSLI